MSPGEMSAGEMSGRRRTEGRFTVVEPGPLTTIQDRGRAGWAHLGMPGSGALDRRALDLANRLVGNPAGAAALECTNGQLVLVAQTPLVLAVAGAPAPLLVNGRGQPLHTPVAVAAGSRVELGPPAWGVRSYLALAGGIEAPATYGSRSTDLLSNLGPAPLQAGDVVHLGPAVGDVPWGLEAPALPQPTTPTVRLHPGPRLDWFKPGTLDDLRRHPYVVTPKSNRVGLRLEGAPLVRSRTDELPSEGLVTGAVEVPTGGQPLIFLADHPTTGGYPVVAVVDPDDLDLLAQAAPGTQIHFT